MYLQSIQSKTRLSLCLALPIDKLIESFTCFYLSDIFKEYSMREFSFMYIYIERGAMDSACMEAIELYNHNVNTRPLHSKRGVQSTVSALPAAAIAAANTTSQSSQTPVPSHTSSRSPPPSTPIRNRYGPLVPQTPTHELPQRDRLPAVVHRQFPQSEGSRP